MLIDTLNCMHDTSILPHPLPACQHPTTISYLNNQNCSFCGAYVHQSPTTKNTRAFKLPRGTRTRLEISPSLIYETMLKTEKDGATPNSAYLKARRPLVDAVASLGEKLRLTSEVIHISVYYMDQILNTFESKNIKPDKFSAVSVACLIVAAKYYELDRQIPFIDDYSRVSKTRLSVPLLKEYERHVLGWLNWNLSAHTPSIFVQLIALQGMCKENEKSDAELLKQTHLCKLCKFSELFADFVVADPIFVQKKMSILSAACVMAARKAVKIEPVWNAELEQMLKYKQQDIEECSRVVFNSYYSMISAGKEAIEWPLYKENISHKDKENMSETNTVGPKKEALVSNVFNLEEHKKNLENMKSSIENKLSVLDNQSKTLEKLIK